MTRRRGRRRNDPVRSAALGIGALLAVAAVVAVLHAIGALVVLAAVGGGGYALGRRHRPGRSSPPASVLARVTAERDELARQVAGWGQWHAGQSAELAERERQAAAVAAERDRLAWRVAELTDACHAAWDRAADRERPPPVPADPDERLAGLLADRFSGVRRLGPA